MRLDQIFYYDARRDLIVISPDATELVQAMTAEQARNLAQLPVVLALSRALQEQHFQWQARLNGIALEDRRLAFRALAVGDTVLLGTAYLQGSQRTTRPPDSVETSTDGQPRWIKWARIYPNCCNKSYYSPIARAVDLLNGLMPPKDGPASMLFLPIRHFRPRRFFTQRNITSNEKIPGYPRFRLGAANDGKRNRRSDIG